MILLIDRGSHEHYCSRSEQIDSIWRLLHGNGDEGLRARMARLEERIEQVRGDIRSLRDDDMARMEAKLRWSLTLFMLIGSFLGNMILKYFWR